VHWSDSEIGDAEALNDLRLQPAAINESFVAKHAWFACKTVRRHIKLWQAHIITVAVALHLVVQLE